MLKRGGCVPTSCGGHPISGCASSPVSEACLVVVCAGKVIQTVVMQCPLSFLSGSALDLLDEDDETELEDDDDAFFDDDGDL